MSTSHIALTANGSGIRLIVDFCWVEDRFQHQLLLQREGNLAIPLLTSVEGVDTDWWPDSPPLQEITAAVPGDNNCLLGVGMAGKSHWSLAMQAGDQPTRVIWDVACRLTHAPQELGSHYAINCDVENHAAGLLLKAGATSIQLDTSVEIPTLLEPMMDGSTVRQVRIVPQLGALNLPDTIRWRYQAGIANS